MGNKCLYVDNDNNFYLYREVALKSKLDWVFVIFEKFKEKLCDEYGIEYVRIKPYGESYKGLPDDILRRAVSSDRVLRWLPTSISIKILKKQLGQFDKILSKHHPAVVIGEISWANEYCFYKLCQERRIKYRHPLNIPTKDCNRVVLFDAEHSYDSLLENHQIASNETFFSDGGAEKKPSIDYYSLCNELKAFNSKKNLKFSSAMNFFNLLDQVQEYRHNQFYYKMAYLVRGGYAILDRLVINVFFGKSLEEIKARAFNKKLIFFPLHIQPESTPDFVSPVNSDQLKLIHEQSRLLSDNFFIVVKDHPNKVSIRNIFKLLKILKNKNVILAKREVSSADLINISSCTATVAGTAAIESIRNGVPAVVFSNVFYKKSRYVFQLSSNQRIEDVINNYDCRNVYDDIDLSDYGVDGFVHDPYIFPDVMGYKNISSLAFLIDEFSRK